jgi:hypothetical protein
MKPENAIDQDILFLRLPVCEGPLPPAGYLASVMYL